MLPPDTTSEARNNVCISSFTIYAYSHSDVTISVIVFLGSTGTKIIVTGTKIIVTLYLDIVLL